MGNQIIQSIKTIAQSLVDNAGYDKTRGGFIVGVNSVTNTYSVKVDGVTYPIVRAVDDATYNIGDVVKVVIPCNQATQMYISSSILSDNSLGNKIANATTLAEDAGKLGLDNQLEIKKVSDVANSKNKTFRQDTAPIEGMSSGDVWIDISDNNTLYVYDGTQWVFSGGGNGQDGLNNATILLYHRGATAPEKPTAEVTYTFADASLSPASALNGWTQAIPQVDGNPCWVIATTASATTATDTIAVSEWSTQVKFVEDGAQGATGSTGLNQATIFLYSRTTSTKPSSSTTYTFASGVLSPLPSGWSRSVPASNGNPCYVTTAIAIGYGSDVTITADAWSDPTVLVEDGAEGYSPTVSTGTSSDGSTTITVTNKDGSTTTELVDGTARDGVDSLNDSVFGVQTFEYILDGVTIPVHKRKDGTYYYILNDEEVDVAESDLVHDADGDLVSYQEGGIDESLNDITNNIDAINKEVDGFDAREDALYKSIQDNSLIARKNARVQQGSLIITNDTTTEKITDIKNYLQLDPQAIVIYREEDPIVLIGVASNESESQVGGYMEMRGTSLFIAQESRLSTIRLRSAENIGSLAFVAGSDGHVSLREVLD